EYFGDPEGVAISAPPPFGFADRDLDLDAPVPDLVLRLEELTAAMEPLAAELTLLRRTDGTAALELVHDRSAFSPEAADLLLDRVVTLLRAAAEHPGRPLRELPATGAEERERLLTETFRGPVRGPEDGAAPRACLHDLV